MKPRPRQLVRAVLVGLAWAGLPPIALAQKLGGAPSTDVSWLRVTGALLFCLLLAAAAALVMKGRLRGTPFSSGTEGERQLRLVESLRLSHQVDVCLIECEGRRLLVAATPQGLVMLGDKTAPPQPDRSS